MPTKTRLPAVEGWFTTDERRAGAARLRAAPRAAPTSFPRETFFCKNPACAGREFDEVELSRRGTLWCYTNNCYQPPAPYVPVADPFVPFAIAAVELATEQIVVLGQVVAGVDVEQLTIGSEMELVLDTLYEDDDHEYVVWKWRPASTGGAA